MDQIYQIILENISKGTTILDVGCGNGDFANEFYKRGADVTAVDFRPRPAALNKNIVFRNHDLRSYLYDISSYKHKNNPPRFDIIFCFNVFQFIEKDKLPEMISGYNHKVTRKWMLGLSDILSSNGILAIRTFYKEPNPAFKVVTYNLNELKQMTKGRKILHEKTHEPSYHKGLDGTMRTFYLVDLVVRK